MTQTNQHLIPPAQEILEKYFSQPISIKQLECLSEAERRNVILRVHLEPISGTTPTTVILKQSSQEEDEPEKDSFARFARDWAGLEFLSRFETFGHIIPKFYGGNRELRFILQEDLGAEHASLVDTLTAANKKEAVAALECFMGALGRMHVASFGHVQEYTAVLENDRVGPSGLTPAGSLWKPEENNVRPRVLARLSAFIEVAESENNLPDLLEMAKAMLLKLKQRWPNTLALELYPAFKG